MEITLNRVEKNVNNGLSKLNRRESLLLEALRAWVNERRLRALDVYMKIVQEYPQDLFSAKRGQIIAFLLSQPQKMLEIGERVYRDNKDNHFVYGLYAFALTEFGQYKKAEEIAREGLKLNSSDPWTQHALAHALLALGRPNEGVEFMLSMQHTWALCNSFFFTHCWWHIALFLLDMAESFSKVLEIFDEYICNLNKDRHFNEMNALWLLIYFDIWDIPFPRERWQHVVNYIQKEESWHTDSTLDLLIIYALHKVDEHSFCQSLFNLQARPSQLKHAENVNDHYLTNALWVELALSIRAAVYGQISRAITKLETVLPFLNDTICGSAEQRDLFHQLYISLLLKDKQYCKAISILEKRLEERYVPLRLKQLAEAYKLVGDLTKWEQLTQQFEQIKANYKIKPTPEQTK
jgi:tetratricopeptide (TPR) repeat protein